MCEAGDQEGEPLSPAQPRESTSNLLQGPSALHKSTMAAQGQQTSGAASVTGGYGREAEGFEQGTEPPTLPNPATSVPAEATGAGGGEFYDPTTGTGGTGAPPVTSEPRTAVDWGTQAAKIAGLDQALLTTPGTVFVPSDLALSTYSTLFPASAANIQGAGGAVAVSAHVIPGAVLKTTDFPEGQTTFNTMAGVPIMISKVGNLMQVSSGVSMANVVKSDITAGNAIIHIIDNVLAPVA